MNEKSHFCAHHKAREVWPAGCKVCQRLALEKDIITRVVDVLLKADYLISVDNGEDVFPAIADRDKILAEMMETDEEWLRVDHGDHKGWVFLVYGNGGYDVICDHTTNLETVLKPVNDYCDTMF